MMKFKGFIFLGGGGSNGAIIPIADEPKFGG